MIGWITKNSGKLMSAVGLVWILGGVCIEFYNIAWGTGVWWGEFAFSWALLFLGFLLSCIALFTAANYVMWRSDLFSAAGRRVIHVRDRVGGYRRLLGFILLLLPIWLLQYTAWGMIFHGIYFRTILWAVVVLVASILFAGGDSLMGWKELLASLVLSASIYSVAVSVQNVTDFPFTLGWSEGNRMWDYSLLFGSHLYRYQPANPPLAYLDLGRQLSGGLPFLFGKVTIVQERLWVGLMTIIPYVVLGWISFRLPHSGSRALSILPGLWAWMFLNQGPIHAPLLWCAVLVALAWGRPLWLAVPLVITSGYLAQISRFTWLFAPAMWAGMLELSTISPALFNMSLRTWRRAIVMALAGLVGALLVRNLPVIWSWIQNYGTTSISVDGTTSISVGGENLASLSTKVADQPLLWYRLLPNATYGNGILLGLLIAVAPVIIVLVYLYSSRRWSLSIWQRLAIVLPLGAFLGVGLIVSAKIGGGGDLHNMDMFLIGVMFAAALAWRSVGAAWVSTIQESPGWMRIVILLTIAILGFVPLMRLRPLAFTGDIEWLARLTDVRTPKGLGLLPSDELTESTLEMVRAYVQEAKTRGDVLFMDQRQLLTFGYITDVDLIWEYEKKWMMDKALSRDEGYFEPFYRDLADRRFSLIISHPLRTPIKDGEYQFGEENNAWLKWVSRPVLCYYQPIETELDFRLQLLVPREGPVDCLQDLP